MPVQITIRTPLGALLKARLDERRERIEDVAYRSGIPKSNVYNWISAPPGARLPLAGLLQLRRYLEIPWMEFEAAALAGQGGTVTSDRRAADEQRLPERSALGDVTLAEMAQAAPPPRESDARPRPKPRGSR